MPLGDNIKLSSEKKDKGKDKPLQLVKDLIWQKASLEIKRGIKIGIVGNWKTGKSILALLLAYFNSKYKKDIKEAGYNQVIEVMDAGLLSEIERVIIIEPENKFLTNLTRGVEKRLFRTLMRDLGDNLDIIPIMIPRKEVKLSKKGFEISQKRELFEQLKIQFVDVVETIVTDYGEDTLLIIDSMSAFRKLLDDKFGLLEDVLGKKEVPNLEGVDTYQWAHYANRNTSWHNLEQIKQGFEGWNADVYKSKPKKIKVEGKWVDSDLEYVVEWVKGTMHYLDMGYRLIKNPDKTVDIEIIDGEYTPTDSKAWLFKYPFNSKMGAMPLINCMCEKLLYGEEEE